MLLWIRFLTPGLCFSMSDQFSSICLGVACRGLSGHPLEQWRRRYVLQILLCPKWLMAAPWLNVFGSLIQSLICSAKSLAANWTVGKALIPLTRFLTLFSKVLQSFTSASLGHLPLHDQRLRRTSAHSQRHRLNSRLFSGALSGLRLCRYTRQEFRGRHQVAWLPLPRT